MAKEKNLFTFLNAIFYKNRIEYDKKLAPAFMLSYWLAHDKELIELVNKILPLQFRLKDDIIYTYYFNKVPRKKRFIRWDKKRKTSDKTKKKIEALMEHYGISKKEAKLYVQN